MQLPDEMVSYQYANLLVKAGGEWRPETELQAQHFLPPARLKALVPQLTQVRSQVAAERDKHDVPLELRPLDSGFIDLPDQLLGDSRKNPTGSELARIEATATRLREQVDRVVILGAGGSSLGARALFEALRSSYHNDLPAGRRLGVPRIYFEGDHLDNDALQELIELLQTTCLNPDTREERWAAIVISQSGKRLETAATFRILRKEMADLFGTRSDQIKQLTVPVTGLKDSRLRHLFDAEGYRDEEILTIPDRVGGRFSVFSAAGLLPAAVMGLDIRALMLGAASMTKQFLEEPFERNPVLQYAGVCYLMSNELGKNIRVLSVWSKKLEALGHWYDHLLAESLGKQGHGPTPITAVQTRDLHTRGQQHQEGRRDKLITNLIVKSPKTPALAIAMTERNQDGLNEFNRKTYQDLTQAALQATNQAHTEAARPTADLLLPSLSEHSMGQLMQMLMLATVVEGRLMGVNPYGQPGMDVYQRRLLAALSS